MNIEGSSAVVTGGASGLGLATARRLIHQGAKVVLIDLPGSAGEEAAASLGPNARFAAADVTTEDSMRAALDVAESLGPLRVLVHCAGRGGPVRLLDKEGKPGSLEAYTNIININLIGTFNTLRLVAERMARTEPVDGERGVCVLTASVAAYEGQIGQLPYASSKAGVVGMTIVAARDRGIDEAKLNVNGGAIAIGHPLGATGVRLALTLARELKRARLRYGVASACIGGGQGIALLIENPDLSSPRKNRPWTSKDTLPS